MSKSSHKSPGLPVRGPSSRSKQLAPRIDVSDIQLRRAEQASSLSESAWKFLDQPTARSALLRDEPDHPLSAGRPAGAARNGRELGLSFSGPRVLAGSGSLTPQKRTAARTGAQNVVVLPEPAFLRKFSSVLASGRRAVEVPEPSSQRALKSERSPSQPTFDLHTLINEKVDKTLAQQRLSRFLKNTGFTCSPKKRVARSAEQHSLTKQLVDSLRTKPETLHQSLRDKILEKLAEPEPARSLKQSRCAQGTPNPKPQAPKQSEPRNLVLRRRACWSDKRNPAPAGPCPSPQRDKTKIAQSTVTGADFSFVSQHAADRREDRRKSNRSVSLFEVHDEAGLASNQPTGWHGEPGFGKKRPPAVLNKYTSAFKHNC